MLAHLIVVTFVETDGARRSGVVRRVSWDGVWITWMDRPGPPFSVPAGSLHPSSAAMLRDLGLTKGE